MDFNNLASDMSNEATNGIRPARLRRSCEVCRSNKGKCVPSEQGSNRCQRCVKEGNQCVFLEAKPRPKRAKNSRIRVAEMEEKLDGLMALLASRQIGKEATPSDSASTPSQPAMIVSLPEPDTQALADPFSSASSIPSSQSDSLRVQQPLSAFSAFAFSFPTFDPFNDVISKGVVEFSQAEESVRIFQSKASNFPFVLVPPTITLDSLRREKPFLLLSVLTYAAHTNEKLQSQLELELRESLSKRVIVRGEKSLDLLQGVLVYMAWYHYYFDPDREQIYQLSQMAGSMVVDLGINKPSEDFLPTDARLSKARPLQAFLPKSPEKLEMQRTFLGCYFLTSSICHGLRKPNALKYSDHMEQCAESLAHAANADTDYLLPYYIRFQRLAEEVDQAFDYSTTQKLPQLDTMRIEILVKAFEQQLIQFESTFPTHIWKNASITMRFYNLRIYINEVGFHATKPSEMEVMSSTTTLRSWYYSAARNESLIRCLQATKDYLDQYLLLTPEAVANFAVTDLVSFIYAVLILGAFATGACDSQSLDITQIKQTANLDYYLDALSGLVLQNIAATKEGSNEYKNHLHALLQQSKKWYSQLAQDPTPIDQGLVGRPTFSFMEIIPTIVGRCVDFSGLMTSVSSGLSEVDSDEQWTEMLSGWTVNNMELDAALV